MTARIRPVEEDDIPQIAQLRRRTFRVTVARTDDELERALEITFFRNPWRSDIAGFVGLSEAGDVIGFVGHVPRPLQLFGEPVTGAAISQLMTDPAHRGRGTGRALLQSLYDLPVRCIITDSVTTPVLRTWRAMGGVPVPVTRFQWTIPLRRMSELGASLAGDIGARAFKPLDTLLNAVRRPRGIDPDPPGSSTTLDPSFVVEQLPAIIGNEVLRADYTAASFLWLLQRLFDKYGAEHVHSRCIRLPDGALVGWFVTVFRARQASVYHLAADRERYGLLLDHIIRDARDTGATELRGRWDAAVVDHVAARGGSFHIRGNGVAFRSSDARVRQAIMEGSAAVDGLLGEWWMSF